MADRETIIKGLEWWVKHQEGEVLPLAYSAVVETLEVLKKQKAVEPEVYLVGQDKYKFYRCPECKTAWYCKCNYCLGCGRMVKWDG